MLIKVKDMPIRSRGKLASQHFYYKSQVVFVERHSKDAWAGYTANGGSFSYLPHIAGYHLDTSNYHSDFGYLEVDLISGDGVVFPGSYI